MKHNLLCKHCGKIFVVLYDSCRIQKYCSRKCSLEHLHESLSKPKKEVNCKQCKKIFLVYEYELKKRLFCSLKCQGKYYSIQGLRSGKNNGHWKGGISKHTAGYLFITHGNEAGKLVHRKIMEESLGRPLTDNELIHHITGNKKDNRISNLQLTNRSEHPRLHKSHGGF